MDPFAYLQSRMGQLWREFDREFAPLMQRTGLETPAVSGASEMGSMERGSGTMVPSTGGVVAPFAGTPFFPSLGYLQSIRLDVSETPRQVEVLADLPGFAKENIQATVDDAGMLHIRATRSEERRSEEGNEEWKWRERHSGAVHRTVQLPATVDPAEAQAEFRDGVLQLRFGKKPDQARHQIAIN